MIDVLSFVPVLSAPRESTLTGFIKAHWNPVLDTKFNPAQVVGIPMSALDVPLRDPKTELEVPCGSCAREAAPPRFVKLTWAAEKLPTVESPVRNMLVCGAKEFAPPNVIGDGLDSEMVVVPAVFDTPPESAGNCPAWSVPVRRFALNVAEFAVVITVDWLIPLSCPSVPEAPLKLTRSPDVALLGPEKFPAPDGTDQLHVPLRKAEALFGGLGTIPCSEDVQGLREPVTCVKVSSDGAELPDGFPNMPAPMFGSCASVACPVILLKAKVEFAVPKQV